MREVRTYTAAPPALGPSVRSLFDDTDAMASAIALVLHLLALCTGTAEGWVISTPPRESPYSRRLCVPKHSRSPLRRCNRQNYPMALSKSEDEEGRAGSSKVNPEVAFEEALEKLFGMDADEVDLDDTSGTWFDRPGEKWQRDWCVRMTSAFDEIDDGSSNDFGAKDSDLDGEEDPWKQYNDTYRLLELCTGNSDQCDVDVSVVVDATLGDDDGRGERLIPEANPQADPDATSLGGVPYGTVLSGLLDLFPPYDLDLRNAVSRRDGYWKYVSKGEDPPKHLTYGEFDFHFFAQLLDRARYHHGASSSGKKNGDGLKLGWDGMTFTDIGSGTGRLVFAAGALHPNFRLCRGIEILPTIQRVAEQNLKKCRPERSGDKAQEERKRADGGKRGSGSELWLPSENQSNKQWLDNFSYQLFGGTKFTSFDHLDEGNDAEDEDNEEWFNPDEYSATFEEEDDLCNEGEDGDHYDDFDDDGKSKKDECDVQTHVLDCPSLDGSSQALRLAPIEFACGSFKDPYQYFGDSDVVFVFSSCMSSDMMDDLGLAVGRQLKPGSVVITTEFQLPLEGDIAPLLEDESLPHGHFRLEMIEQVDGWCWLTGGASTAFIHRVEESLWEEGGGPRERPRRPVVEEARDVVANIRSGELADEDAFFRGVHNNIAFFGLPDEWRRPGKKFMIFEGREEETWKNQ